MGKQSIQQDRPLKWVRSTPVAPAELESEQLNRSILSSLPGVVHLVDRDGRIIRAGTGATFRDDVLLPFQRAKPGEDYYACWTGFDSCLAGCSNQISETVRAVAQGFESERSIECRYSAMDGERWLEIRAHRLNRPEGGAVIHHVDITARKRAEMLARQDLESACHSNRVAAMGKLAASLAHEVSQPLAAILTNAEASIRCLDRPAFPLEEIQGVLADIASDARRTASIIQNIRALLKKREVKPTLVSLNSAIGDALRLIAHRAQMRQVRLDLDLAESLPMVRADHIQLQQVILNLAANGVDAMESSPENLRVLTIRTRIDSSGTGVLMEVSDRGEGIAGDDLMSVFEPFRSTKREGLGMGLAISRSIVEGVGGRIWPQRRAAGGMSFFVQLPSADGSETGFLSE